MTFQVNGLVGFTASGLTSSTLSAPDVPITSFELSLPEGPHSILASTDTDLCGKTLTLPTTLVAHNGAKLIETNPIAVTGCSGPPPSVKSYAAAVHGNNVVVVVDLAKAGELKLSGQYVRSYSHSLRAGSHRIELRLTSSGVTARRHHRRTSVKLAFAGTTKTAKLTL